MKGRSDAACPTRSTASWGSVGGRRGSGTRRGTFSQYHQDLTPDPLGRATVWALCSWWTPSFVSWHVCVSWPSCAWLSSSPSCVGGAGWSGQSCGLRSTPGTGTMGSHSCCGLPPICCLLGSISLRWVAGRSWFSAFPPSSGAESRCFLVPPPLKPSAT